MCVWTICLSAWELLAFLSSPAVDWLPPEQITSDLWGHRVNPLLNGTRLWVTLLSFKLDQEWILTCICHMLFGKRFPSNVIFFKHLIIYMYKTLVKSSTHSVPIWFLFTSEAVTSNNRSHIAVLETLFVSVPSFASHCKSSQATFMCRQ